MSTGSEGPVTGLIVRVASVSIFLALIWTLLVGIAPNVNTRVVQTGEMMWPGYAATLRTDPEAPTCDLADIDAKLASCPSGGAAAAPAPVGNPFEDAPAPAGNPFEDAPAPVGNPFEDAPAPVGNPFEDPPPAAAGVVDAGNPFADEPAAAAGNPFEDPPPAVVNCPALRGLRDVCAERHTLYDTSMARITPTVKVFRRVEGFISDLATFPFWRELLVVVVMLGGLATTLHRMHIGLRDPKTLIEHRARQGAELLAHLVLIGSNVADWRVQAQSSAEVENAGLPLLWALGFVVLSLVNVAHLVHPPKDLTPGGTTPVRLLMVVPLYAWMVLVAGFYFTAIEWHPSGQAIYLHKFVQIPGIYLGIGLYIWAGMLLSRTRLAPMTFNLLLPWKLPPAILAWIVGCLSAIPTAYSGASGIFVLAAGAVIFDRLTKAGASNRLALAATAMSGSLGVVLRPCLVVVLIAVLNKQVTTSELFSKGLMVYGLTCVLFLLAMLWRNDRGFRMAAPGDALPATVAAAKRVAPYLGIAVAVMVFFAVGLSTWLNEHTAPYVMPVVLLSLVVYDKWRGPAPDDEPPPGETEVRWQPLWPALISATRESSHHVGALLMLMACSVAVGGMVERSEVMERVVPESFGSVWIAMTFLLVAMVLVGMTMDALGAVILVSFSIAKIAYANGIDPIHFWMMVLCAFELGYLTPPVALNQLLARQVVGEPSHVEDQPVSGGFLNQYEHIVVPMIIMASALVIVAYGPLFFYG